MGDSEDEFDRRGRGRDKFRGERNDFQRRDDRRNWDDNKREQWSGRENRGEFDRQRRFSPQHGREGSPPQKRIRGEDGAAGMEIGQSGKQSDVDYPTQPAMITFKAFLAQQDDNISDEDAFKKFNEYKLDFKKQQIHEFFLAHKEEEWFRGKYHPEEVAKKKELADTELRARCDAFCKLLELGYVEKANVDTDNNEAIIKLLDAAVILMEGGTDFDLQVLDSEYKPETQRSTAPAEKPKVEVPPTANQDPEENKDDKPSEEIEEKATENGEELSEENKEAPSQNPDEKPLTNGEESVASPQPQLDSTEDGETKSPDQSMETTDTPEEPTAQEESQPPPTEEKVNEEEKKDKSPKKGKKRRRDSDDSFTSSSDSEGSLSDSESETDKTEAPKETKPEAPARQEGEKDMDTKEKEDLGPQPQALHKTQSIFLRNLDPSITKQEVESMCRQYPGFLRVGLQDPLPERRFFRRGWLTFDRTVNIKDICWNLNNIRLRDCDMGAIVNRELKQRVRPIGGLTSHKPVVKADIKHAAKIVQSLDKKTGLWEEKDGEKTDKEKPVCYGLVSRNPVLKNITDYLVDEGSYEEEAYLGAIAGGEEQVSPTEQNLERDEENVKVLDRMILYLRIVHSFDFYMAVEYPSEDEMPHRCGIIHARAPPPKIVSENEVAEYNSMFENKVKSFLNMKCSLSDEEAVRLGKKSEEEEVEKFLQANTQELAKDKWLCPLSGKKFKGPEFIRKHILVKHTEKVEAVKEETSYFNNYLMDPKRPQLPEHPYQKSRGGSGSSATTPGGGSGEGAGYHGGGYQQGGGGYQGGGGGGYYRPPYQGNRGNWRGGGGNWRGGGGYRRGGFNNYNASGGGNNSSSGGMMYRRDSGGGRYNMASRSRDRSRSDPRGIIEYRDLDAPDEADIF